VVNEEDAMTAKALMERWPPFDQRSIESVFAMPEELDIRAGIFASRAAGRTIPVSEGP